MQAHRKILKLEMISTSYMRSQKSHISSHIEAAGCILHIQREEEKRSINNFSTALF